MNKKIILSKTIVFVCIVGFITLFKTIFGAENALIGVTSITALLMFLERDLTIAPWKNTMKLIGLNLFIGCTATLASTNMWIAIPVNFMAIFILGHSLLYNLKKPMYLPFILQYLFILASPVPAEKLPMRLLALIVGAVTIMGMQLLTNKGKLTKTGNKLLERACTSLTQKAISIKEDKGYECIDKEINRTLHEFRRLLYDKRENDFYLTEEGMIKLNLSVSLQKISYLLDKMSYTGVQQEVIDDLMKYLDKLKDCLNDTAYVKQLKQVLQQLFNKYEDKQLKDTTSLEILNHLGFLENNFKALETLKEEHYNSVKKLEDIPNEYKKSIILNGAINRDSIKFSYAMRLAIGITLAGFITDFFNLSEGRWIMFTVLSLIVPIYELSKQKVKDRLFATVVGGIIVTLLFGVFQDLTIRTMILMLAGYIGSYLTAYRYSTICVTVSAIGAVALMGNTQVFTINRIIFVALGALIASLLNKFVFPFRIDDHNKQLKKMYKETIAEMFKAVYEVAQGRECKHRIKNLLIIASLIEEQLRLNNQIVVDETVEKLEKARCLLLTNIYELYIWISENKIKEVDIQHILEDIKTISNADKQDILPVIEGIQKHMDRVKGINDKVILGSMLNILQEEAL